MGCGAAGAPAGGLARLGEREGSAEHAREGQGAEARKPGIHPSSFRFRTKRGGDVAKSPTSKAPTSKRAEPRSEGAPSFHIRRRNPTSFSRHGYATSAPAARASGRRREHHSCAPRRSVLAAPADADVAAPAIAMHGAPALPAGLRHAALRQSARRRRAERCGLACLGAFDSLNPYNVKALSTAAGALRPCLRIADGALARRAVHALRPRSPRAIETDAARDYATSSASIPGRISPTVRRSPPPTCASPSNCCAPRAGRRSARRSRSSRSVDDAGRAGRSASISPAPTTANCRSSSR